MQFVPALGGQERQLDEGAILAVLPPNLSDLLIAEDTLSTQFACCAELWQCHASAQLGFDQQMAQSVRACHLAFCQTHRWYIAA